MKPEELFQQAERVARAWREGRQDDAVNHLCNVAQVDPFNAIALAIHAYDLLYPNDRKHFRNRFRQRLEP